MIRFNYIFISLLLVIAVSLGGCGTAKTADLMVREGATNQVAETEPQLGAVPESAEMERKIIQNADLDLRVRDVAGAVEQIISLCEENDGYVVRSRLFRDGERVSADLSIKVPQLQLNDVVAAIAQLGEMTDKVISTEDVSEEYYDAQARLKALKAKEERLLGLINKAANVSEIVSIESELGKTRSDIEVLAGRLKYLSNATTYSQVRINLREGVPGVIKAPQGTLGKAGQALLSSLNALIMFASQTVVFLFVILPWLLVGTLLFLLLRYLYRWRKVTRSGGE